MPESQAVRFHDKGKVARQAASRRRRTAIFFGATRFSRSPNASRLTAMGNMRSASVFDKVRGFIERLAPEPVCDDCITDKLGLTQRQHANRKTNELAGTDGFVSGQGPCSLCGEPRKIIRKAR